jgi:hypothetical protein
MLMAFLTRLKGINMKLEIVKDSHPFVKKGQRFKVKRLCDDGSAVVKTGVSIPKKLYELDLKFSIDWSTIQSCFTQAAMDEDGSWWVYYVEPHIGGTLGDSAWGSDGTCSRIGQSELSETDLRKYWKHSLLKRPMIERPVNKFRIEAVGDAVVFQVLEMDERFRYKLDGTRTYDGSEMRVASAGSPEVLNVELVYLRGLENYLDDRASLFRCANKTSAIRLAEKLARSLIEWAEMYEGFSDYSTEVKSDYDGRFLTIT